MTTLGLTSLAPGKDLTVVLKHADGTSDTIVAKHSMTLGQIEYFKAGSSVNLMGSKA